MKNLPQISNGEFEVMDVIWKHAPINTNEIVEILSKRKILQFCKLRFRQFIFVQVAGHHLTYRSVKKAIYKIVLLQCKIHGIQP